MCVCVSLSVWIVECIVLYCIVFDCIECLTIPQKLNPRNMIIFCKLNMLLKKKKKGKRKKRRRKEEGETGEKEKINK